MCRAGNPPGHNGHNAKTPPGGAVRQSQMVRETWRSRPVPRAASSLSGGCRGADGYLCFIPPPLLLGLLSPPLGLFSRSLSFLPSSSLPVRVLELPSFLLSSS